MPPKKDMPAQTLPGKFPPKLLAFKVLVGKVAREVNCPKSNVVRAEGNKFYRWL